VGNLLHLSFLLVLVILFLVVEPVVLRLEHFKIVVAAVVLEDI
jgi:hypothetical protein